MNTKKMIAVLAVLAMAMAAFAFVPGEDVSAADDLDVVEIDCGTLVSEFKGTTAQKIVIKKDLTILENGSLTIEGDLYIPADVTVTIDGGKMIVKNASATIDGTVVVKSGTDTTFKIETEEDGKIVINGTIRTSGTGTEVTISDADAEKNVLVNGEIIVGTNTKVTLDGAYFNAESKLTAYGEIVATDGIYMAGTAILDGVVGMPKFIIAETSAEIDVASISQNATVLTEVTITDEGMFAYALGGVQYYVIAEDGDAPAYAPQTEEMAKAAIAKLVDGNDDDKVAVNKITLTNVKNVKITENVLTQLVYDKDVSQEVKIAETSMIIGALDATKAVEGITTGTDDSAVSGSIADDAAGKTVTFGDMDVDEVAITISGEAKVIGEVNYFNSKEEMFVVTAGTAKLTVTGLLALKTYDAKAIAKINAAYFTERVGGDKYYYYTTLDQAIALDAKDIKMLGEFVVDKDLTLPADVKVDASGTDVVAVVKKGATLTVDAGAAFLAVDVYVYGALDIKDSTKNVSIENIYADVKTVADSEEFYSNVYVAFANAKAGDKLTAYNPVKVLTDSVIIIDKNLTLPAGVSFNNTSKLAGVGAVKIFVANGVVFTIDGTLTLDLITSLAQGTVTYDPEIPYKPATTTGVGWNSKTPAINDDDKVADFSVISIGDEGVLEYDGFGTLNDATGVYGEYFIAGAYFAKKVSGTSVNYITNVPLAFAGILDAEGKKVDIYGDVVIDAPVAGTEKDLVTVNLNGSDSTKMTLDGFTFANAKVDAKAVTLTGDIGTANGSIVFDDATVTAVFSELWINDAMNFLVNKTYGIDDLTASATIYAKNPTYISKNVYFGSVTYEMADDAAENADITFTVPAGAALYILGAVTMEEVEIIIEGDLIVTNTAATTELEAGTVSILGTATVVNLDGRAGTLIADIIMVGGFSDSFALFKYEGETAGEAVLAGSGAVTTGALFVFNGATITADILLDWMENDTVNTEFFVDGALWMTAYTADDDGYAIAVTSETTAKTEYYLVPALENMTFKTWQTYDEKAKKFVDIKPAVTPGEDEAAPTPGCVYVGQPGFETVYAYVDKEIFMIEVVADVGIDDVSIDGKLMVKKGTVHEAFVAAGPHTLSYTLANGYSGNAVITTIDGKAILGAGLSFEVSDNNYDDVKGKMTITLSGVEKSGIDVDPETHPEQPAPGLTTTEILLIVVVIIMAIMAVVLILRLNRS